MSPSESRPRYLSLCRLHSQPVLTSRCGRLVAQGGKCEDMRRLGFIKQPLSVFVALSLIAGCSGSDTKTSNGVSTNPPTSEPAPADSTSASVPTSDASATTAASLPPVDVPQPPPPAAISGTTPQEQALSLSTSVSTAADPIGGWVAAYDSMGIPVLGAGGTGIGTTADDPIGPTFAAVWMQSDAALKTSGLPLSDIVRMYVDEDSQSAGLGDLLLADLRAAITSADLQVSLFGNFVAERARHTGPGTDLADPAATADVVYVDVATAQLISWVALRGFATVAAAGNTSIMGFRSIAVPAKRSLRADIPCAEIAGSETMTFWTNFIANKIGSGLELPGMSSALKGLIEKIAELNPHIIDVDKVQKLSALAKKANLVGGLLSLLMQINSLQVDFHQVPEPLQRNKLQSEGEGKTTLITWDIFMDIGSLPDGSKKIACAATAILNFLGVGFSFPADGKLAGVDVTFKGHLGFGQGLDTSNAFVVMNQPELQQTTDAEGQVKTTITAKAQKRDYPDSAKQVLRDFSIDVSAQVEPENINSLFNVFFDGFTASDALGVGSGAVDIAKTLHWDLGEQTFRMYDWQAGWKIDQVLQGWTFTGIVCDTQKPFTLNAVLDADVSGVYAFTPSADGTATWSFTGIADGAFPLHAQGTAKILSPENSDVELRLDKPPQLMADLPGIGPAPLPGVALDEGDLLLVPLDTEECSQG